MQRPQNQLFQMGNSCFYPSQVFSKGRGLESSYLDEEQVFLSQSGV